MPLWLISGLGSLKSVPRGVWLALGAVLIAVCFYLALNAYGNSRFNAGKAEADAAWKAASDRLIEKAHKSAAKADVAAAARAADYAAKVEDERERIDAATAEGSSPMDVLFGESR